MMIYLMTKAQPITQLIVITARLRIQSHNKFTKSTYKFLQMSVVVGGKLGL